MLIFNNYIGNCECAKYLQCINYSCKITKL